MTRKAQNQISFLIIMALCVIFLSGCGNRPDNAEETSSPNTPANNQPSNTDGAAAGGASGQDGANPVVTIEMDNEKMIRVELYPEVAPNTVNNFISLVQSGAYDGTVFHRIIKDYMIQGGDPEGSGLGGPGYSIKGEFSSNGFPNGLSHTRGVISMARSEGEDTAGSQFFIMHGDVPNLDGNYAAFGEVIEGIEVVDELAELPVSGPHSRPLEPPVMTKVTVELHGKTYPEPEIIEDELPAAS